MNNTKRILFILLLILGLIGIGATVYFMFLKKDPNTVPVVRNDLETGLPPAGTVTTPPVVAPLQPETPPSPDSASELERKAREALFRRARDLTSRIGTYGNADDYAALTDVYADVTGDVQSFLETQRNDLRTAHPGRGSSYTQTTRALAARLTQDVAVQTASEAEVVVDTQQRIEDGGSDATVVRQAVLQLTRVNNVWKVSRITWQEPGL